MICSFFLFIGGKRDETLILPANDSISATLDTDQVNMQFCLAKPYINSANLSFTTCINF